MKLKVSVEGKKEIEKFILLLNIGLASALMEGAVSIEEAENYLFSPYSVRKLDELGISECVTEIIQLGCELEDVESLIPQKLQDNINMIKLKSLEKLKTRINKSLPCKKWID